MKVALTGATGNMGRATLEEILKIPALEQVKLLILPTDKRVKKIRKAHKKDKNRIEIVLGDLADEQACKKLIEGVDYVLNLASVIPPHSDRYPERAVQCNEKGVDALVRAVENAEPQPKLVHISTLALYGNRNSLHPWAQVGDPLLVSPFDIYSATKMRGEFRVLESKVQCWAVLRQTAMLHKNMLADNMDDGLMFHTCFNAPLEWATAHDSGVLMANILKKDVRGELPDGVFWKKVFNIGGGIENAITGYDTLNDGFRLIGGSTADFFKPYYNATRNFHGAWFYDSDALNDIFNYRSQTVADYWREIGRTHRYYALGKIVPKCLIAKFAIKRLFKSPNSPAYWYKHNDIAKLTAYFGSKENYEKLLKTRWKDFPLLIENRAENGDALDYAALKDRTTAKTIDHGYDISKKDEEITLADLQNVAKLHGGKLLTDTFAGDMYAP
ncbi:MAG: NAD-dependent epimerase/dehydratase family protein, partial [Clostridiales bacterium]|nr:NAD-dependent epimerase/dehydratase family protein [Clostridiales bacterium]